ncbi:MAG: hypothetical protein MdMp014T_2782 [Treponematales bacterium]
MNLIDREMKSELVRMARNYAIMGHFEWKSLDVILDFINLVSEPEREKGTGGVLLEFPRENWVGAEPPQAPVPTVRESLNIAVLNAEVARESEIAKELEVIGVPHEFAGTLAREDITADKLLKMTKKQLTGCIRGFGAVKVAKVIAGLESVGYCLRGKV